jgi:hypothetical protein
MADIEAAQSNHFDIIEGLHCKSVIITSMLLEYNHQSNCISFVIVRFMNNILEAIFQYLDAESLRNTELTCKAWKAAASDSNPKKLWQVLLHTKVSSIR